MDFVDGRKEPKALNIQDILTGDYAGNCVTLRGSIHTVRHMGEVSFVILRKAEGLPISISKYKMNTTLETKLALRPISLRNIRERAKFKIQEGIVRGFRDYLHQQNFTEIHTPKIVARGAEGGSNVFKLDLLKKEYTKELKLLEIQLPRVDRIPTV